MDDHPMLHPRRCQLEAVIRAGERAVARCLVRRGRYVIGSDRKNEIVVDEESISANHARLTIVADGEIYLEDFGSSNGTTVDGLPIDRLTRISFDSVIMLGQTRLDFLRAGLPAAVFTNMPEGFLRGQRYNLGQPVVEGSTSMIYEARDTSLNRDVALKLMLPQSQSSTAQVLRFVREAQITSQLLHPGIPPIYDLSVDEQGHLFYTTRFVEGESLADITDSLYADNEAAVERWTFGALLTVFQKVCDAVAFAHTRGVVHCALRPETIMAGGYGEVFVLTWGTARMLPEVKEEEGALAIPRVHAPEGSLVPFLTPFSAPEQATETWEEVDARTDVYALGGLLYRLITLRDPVIAGDETALLERILTGGVTPAEEARQGKPGPHWPGGQFPEYLAEVARKALSFRREDRHASVAELQKQVRAWQEGLVEADGGKRWKGFAGLLGR